MEKNYNLFDTKNYFTFMSAGDMKAPCVVVVPGGGYHHTSNREAKNVAMEFVKRGIHACVLFYREEIISYPEPQQELAYVIDWVRNNELVINDKIICIGFSAGAHLALSQACYYKEFGYNSRPNLLVLAYPVISTNEKISHARSFELLLKGLDNADELKKKLSLENNLPDDLCDVFLWHTITDKSVPIFNSLELCVSMSKKHINYEAHIFPEGPHGMSLADETCVFDDMKEPNRYIGRWVQLMFDWIHYKFN